MFNSFFFGIEKKSELFIDIGNKEYFFWRI